jgi:hypothetical protein
MGAEFASNDSKLRDQGAAKRSSFLSLGRVERRRLRGRSAGAPGASLGNRTGLPLLRKELYPVTPRPYEGPCAGAVEARNRE